MMHGDALGWQSFPQSTSFAGIVPGINAWKVFVDQAHYLHIEHALHQCKAVMRSQGLDDAALANDLVDKREAALRK